METKTGKLYFTRHGETDWNAAHRIQGHTDIELNDNGIQDAYRTKENLRNKKIEVIMSSPLKRALKKAEIIAGGGMN